MAADQRIFNLTEKLRAYLYELLSRVNIKENQKLNISLPMLDNLSAKAFPLCMSEIFNELR